MPVVADMSNVIDEEIWELCTSIVMKRQLFQSESYLARAETCHLLNVTADRQAGGWEET